MILNKEIKEIRQHDHKHSSPHINLALEIAENVVAMITRLDDFKKKGDTR